MRIWQILVGMYPALGYLSETPPAGWRIQFAALSDKQVRRAIENLPRMAVRQAPNVSQFIEASRAPDRFLGVPDSDAPRKLLEVKRSSRDSIAAWLATLRAKIGRKENDGTD